MRPPQLIADVYRDLRDRRLLAPALALLVALVAVPLVLANSPEPPPPPSAAAEVEPTAAAPAVLAEGPGIRNYRKRLDALNRKNPFDQRFTAPEPGSADITEPGPGPDAIPAERDDPAPGGSPPPDGASSGPPATSTPSPQPTEKRGQAPGKPTLYTWTTDLVFGPVGATKRYGGARALDLLPSRANPVVAMLGAGPVGKRATFLMPEDLASSTGDGSCAPSNANCFFLRLRPGEERRLTVAPDGEPEVVYRLKVLRIKAKVVKRRGS